MASRSVFPSQLPLLAAGLVALGLWARGAFFPWSLAAPAVFVVFAGAHAACLLRPGKARALPATRALLLVALGLARGSTSPAPPGDSGDVGGPTRARGVVDWPAIDLKVEGRVASLRFSIAPEDGSESLEVLCPAGPVVPAGALVEATGTLRPALGPRNPGEPGGLSTRRLVLPASDGLQVLDPWPTRRWSSWIGRVRGHVLKAICEHYPEELRGFVLAMVLGDRRLLDEGTREALLLTGTFHLLAISGLHISLLTLWLTRVPLPPVPGVILQVLVLSAFTLITGASPPVLRAAIMVCLHGLARRFGRKASPLDTLGWSAVLLLLAEPGLVRDASFQLSFVSVAALLTWGSPPLPARRLDGRPPGPGARGLRLLLASAGASAATTPLSLELFQRLHPLGPIWNLLGFPLTVVPFAGGSLSVALASVSRPLASAAARATTVASRWLLWPLVLGAEVPGSAVHWPRPPLACLAATYAALALGLSPARRRAAWLLLGGSAAASLALALLGPARPELWTFDAGAGDAQLLRLPGAGAVLIDAGWRGAPATAGARLTQAVLATGTRSLDAVVLTHCHADHTRAFSGLIDRLPAGRVLVPPGFDTSPAGRGLLERARLLGIPHGAVERGWELLPRRGGKDNVTIEILHPPPGPVGRAAVPNESSLALRIRREDRCVLLLGDLEERGIAALLCRAEELQAQVLVAPHHGRATPLWEALESRVAPESVVISGDGDGGAAALRAALLSRGRRVFATWITGAVVTEWIPGRGWVPRAAR